MGNWITFFGNYTSLIYFISNVLITSEVLFTTDRYSEFGSILVTSDFCVNGFTSFELRGKLIYN